MTRLNYVLLAAWQGFWRNPVMSLASTFTVGLMLLLFAFMLATDRGLQAAVGVLESKVELALFLEDDARVSDILVTKEQAMQRLTDIAATRKDIQIVDISSNPLPASLEIKLAHAQDAARVSANLRAEVGGGVVHEVVDNPSVVDKLLTVTRVLSFGGVAVLSMMLVVALFVIVNTIRIAVHARRDEIEIMKLVGATDWFVRWPFVLEGMLVGTLGAVAALTVVVIAAGPVTSSLVAFLEIVPLSLESAFLWQLAASVFGLALLVGGAGAMLSVRAHLAK